MSSYGRNFEFRVPPEGAARGGRYSLGGSTDLPIGVPVVVDGGTDDLGRLTVQLASEAHDRPLAGTGGVLVYEYGPAAFAGDDPLLTTYSDKDHVAVGQGVQVVNDQETKVVLRNTSARTFLHTRTYAAFKMVAPAALGATPVAVGDMLTPGVGNATDGYWKKTTDATKAWAVVTKVDVSRGEVEARLTF